METSARYLHKKFKKQLTVVDVPPSHDDAKTETPPPPSVITFQPPICSSYEPPPMMESRQSLARSPPLALDYRLNFLPPKSPGYRERVVPIFYQKSSTNQEEPVNYNLVEPTSSISQHNISHTNNNELKNHTTPKTLHFQQQELEEKQHIFYNNHRKIDNRSSMINFDESEVLKDEPEAGKIEEVLPPPDRNPNGKYVCTYCNLVCSKPSVLQKHIRAHTNERPFPCVSCGFSFKTRSNLYKHCRSRTHANRVMGNKAQETIEQDGKINENIQMEQELNKAKPYKPRFHTAKFFDNTTKENLMAGDAEQEDELSEEGPARNNDLLSHHINEIISKNNSIVHNNDFSVHNSRLRFNEYNYDEPLNLTNKNRKRCMSEAEPMVQKSLIKELLLKNLQSDMQCQHCKMLFQTVTELQLHKLRSCKGNVGNAKYSRSSSVNVASILTQNKNAFDNIPQMQNTVFPLNSPGPFLGKTRLVEADKTKSFSFDDGIRGNLSTIGLFERERKGPIKLFGGEVKITATSGEIKSFKIDHPNSLGDLNKPTGSGEEFSGKISENRVVKSGLQSGGTVLTNKSNKDARINHQDVIRVFENANVSPSIDLSKNMFNYERLSPGDKLEAPTTPSSSYQNIMDFSQNAVKLLTPTLKNPNITLRKVSLETTKDLIMEVDHNHQNEQTSPKTTNVNPLNLFFNGKVVRYVPGMPGPVTTDDPLELPPIPRKPLTPPPPVSPKNDMPKPTLPTTPKKFARPNSLALKPTTASLKQHHGLTPTMFNQILISPDTPRVAKKFAQHFLHGNYFSYLDLKSSTKSVYCTLNKTQPFYVPHFKKLSMYSEWRQQDTKTDKLYVSGYDSRKRSSKYTMAGRAKDDLMIHSSYKFVVSEVSSNKSDKSQDQLKTSPITGGYESYEDYTYIRGRGRGRYVCDQCGIRCKKPSMLKKHIRTHSNDRPYTCNHCNFSFKTKGNLTKHMKSKAHTKNYAASSSSGSSTQQSSTQSSESDTDDSGMDSSDESTRLQEHEAAYGLLSLSQKTTNTTNPTSTNRNSSSNNDVLMSSEEIAQVSQRNYAKNKILDEKTFAMNLHDIPYYPQESRESQKLSLFLGTSSGSRPLTYPYTSALNCDVARLDLKAPPPTSPMLDKPKCIKQFHVIQKYAGMEEGGGNKSDCDSSPSKVTGTPPTLQVNGLVVEGDNVANELRKRKIVVVRDNIKSKILKNDNEVMDLSMATPEKPLQQQDYLLQPPAQHQHNSDLNGDVEVQDTPLVTPPQVPANFDNSAMETLADIATKQVKLEKNTLAKSVASEFLKLATKNDCHQSDTGEKTIHYALPPRKDVNDLIVKSEGNKSCTICSKSFSKPSQLRLHMNIHYIERPFRCDPCSTSFRTKGHLQKHERSASHHNKLSSSPALSSLEPRPFKCSDCNIAFRIHGHLAKHLRSKMHIMKLECLNKIPIGLYAELERSNSLLTEINTCDGDQCLESLRTLARKVFISEANNLNQLEYNEHLDADS